MNNILDWYITSVTCDTMVHLGAG